MQFSMLPMVPPREIKMKNSNVLVVDLVDSANYLQIVVAQLGLSVEIATNAEQATQCLNETGYHAVLVGLGIRDEHGERFWPEVKTRWPETELVVVSEDFWGESLNATKQGVLWVDRTGGMPAIYQIVTLAVRLSQRKQENRALQAERQSLQDQLASALAKLERLASGDSLEEPILTLREMKERHTEFVLARTGGNKAEAAKLLGVTYSSLWRRSKQKS